jgi:hypothetical protein
MDTYGLALLIEKLNRPCECESRYTGRCRPHHAPSICDGHVRGDRYYHQEPECDVPLDRWWREERNAGWAA